MPGGFSVRRAAAVLVAVVAIAGAFALAREDGGDTEGDPAAFCRAVGELGELVDAAAAGPEEIADVPAARALADDIARAAEQLRETAPPAIADDAQDLAEVTAELARELRDFYQAIGDDPARANDPAFLSSFEPITPDRAKRLAEAGEKVRPWIANRCAPSE